MANIIPNQTRTVDPFSEINSNTVNNLTQAITGGKNSLYSQSFLDITWDGTAANTLEMNSGLAFMSNVIININDPFSIDMSDPDFYLDNNTPLDIDGYYYIVLEYEYEKVKPAPVARVRITKPNEGGIIITEANKYLLLKVVFVSSGQIQSLWDYDPILTSRRRQYAPTFIEYHDNIPSYTSDNKGKVIFVASSNTFFHGNDNEDKWRSISAASVGEDIGEIYSGLVKSSTFKATETDPLESREGFLIDLDNDQIKMGGGNDPNRYSMWFNRDNLDQIEFANGVIKWNNLDSTSQTAVSSEIKYIFNTSAVEPPLPTLGPGFVIEEGDLDNGWSFSSSAESQWSSLATRNGLIWSDWANPYMLSSESYTVSLTRDFFGIPTDQNGNNPNFANAYTDVSAIYGGVDLIYDSTAPTSPGVGKYGITSITPTNCTYSTSVVSNKLRITITSITAESASLFIVVKFNDNVEVAKIFSTAKLRRGQDAVGSGSAYTVILTNETHGIPVDADGLNPNLTGATTDVYAYLGTTLLTYSDSTAGVGEFILSNTFTTNCSVSVDSTGQISITAITADTAYVDVEVTFEDAASILKRWSILKSYGGTDAPLVNVRADNYVFKYQAGSSAPDETSITLISTTQNILTPTYQWYYRRPNQSWVLMAGNIDSTASIVYNDSEWTGQGQISYKCIVDGLYEDSLTLTNILDADSASYVHLIADSYVFNNSNTGAITPTDITLTATTYGITSPTYQWQYWNDSTANWDIIPGETTSTLVVNKADFSEIQRNYKVVVDSTWEDTLTLNHLYQGQDGTAVYTVILTNASHGVPSDPDGSNPNLSRAVTDVLVYKGLTPLTPTLSTPTDGEFKIDSTNVVNCSVSILDSDTVSVTAITADSASVDIVVNCENRTSITQTMSLYKGKQGVAGTTHNAYQVILTNEAHEVLVDGNGTAITGEIGSTGRALTAATVVFNGTTAVYTTSNPPGTAAQFTIINATTVGATGWTLAVTPTGEVYISALTTAASDTCQGQFQIKFFDDHLVTKQFSLRKKSEGPSITLTGDSQLIKYDVDNALLSPADYTLSTTYVGRISSTPYYKWKVSYDGSSFVDIEEGDNVDTQDITSPATASTLFSDTATYSVELFETYDTTTVLSIDTFTVAKINNIKGDTGTTYNSYVIVPSKDSFSIRGDATQIDAGELGDAGRTSVIFQVIYNNTLLSYTSSDGTPSANEYGIVGVTATSGGTGWTFSENTTLGQIQIDSINLSSYDKHMELQVTIKFPDNTTIDRIISYDFYASRSTVSLTASHNIINYEAGGSLSTPATITFDTYVRNTTSPVYVWYIKYDDGSFSLLPSETASSYVFTPTATIGAAPYADNVSVKVEIQDADTNVLDNDIITAGVIQEATTFNAYSIVLTNETHSIRCNTQGDVIDAATELGLTGLASTVVAAIYNEVELTYISSGPGVGQYSISNITKRVNTGSGWTVAISPTGIVYISAVAPGSDDVCVVDFDVEFPDGKLYTKSFSLNKNRNGARATLTSESHILQYDEDGDIKTPTGSIILSSFIDGNAGPITYVWQRAYDGGSYSTISGAVTSTYIYSIPSTKDAGGYINQISFRIQILGQDLGVIDQDTLTIQKTQDIVGPTGAAGSAGVSGVDSYTVVLTNPSHTVLCDGVSIPKTDEVGASGNASTSVRVFLGATEIDYYDLDAIPPVGQFAVSGLTVNGTGWTVAKADAAGKLNLYVNTLSDVATDAVVASFNVVINGGPTTPVEWHLNRRIGAGAANASADRYTLTYDEDGIIKDNSDILVTANTTGDSVITPYYQFMTSYDGAALVNRQNSTSATWTFSSTEYSNFVDITTVEVRMREGSGVSGVIDSDTFTIQKVSDGIVGATGVGYSAVLENEAHTVPSDSDGTVSPANLADAFTETSAYVNATQLTAVASSPTTGQYSISITAESGGNASKASNTKIQLDSMSADVATIAVAFDMEGTTTITRIFSVTKSYSGVAGVDAYVVKITSPTSYIFIYSGPKSSPGSPDHSFINLFTDTSNPALDTFAWTYRNPGGFWVSAPGGNTSSSYTVDPGDAIWTGLDSITFRVKATGTLIPGVEVYDYITISKQYQAEAGAPGATGAAVVPENGIFFIAKYGAVQESTTAGDWNPDVLTFRINGTITSWVSSGIGPVNMSTSPPTGSTFTISALSSISADYYMNNGIDTCYFTATTDGGQVHKITLSKIARVNGTTITNGGIYTGALTADQITAGTISTTQIAIDSRLVGGTAIGTWPTATSGTKTGFWMGIDKIADGGDDEGKFFVGDTAGDNLKWDGNLLTINGEEAAIVTEYTRATTGDIAYWVDHHLGSDITGTGSSGFPFATFSHALSLLPRVINHNVEIRMRYTNTDSRKYIEIPTEHPDHQLVVKGYAGVGTLVLGAAYPDALGYRSFIDVDETMYFGLKLERNECAIRIDNLNWAFNPPDTLASYYGDTVRNGAIQIVNNSSPIVITNCDAASITSGGGSHGSVSALNSSNILVVTLGDIYDKFGFAETIGGHVIVAPPYGIQSTYGSIIHQAYDWNVVHESHRSLFKFVTFRGGIIVGHGGGFQTSTANPPHANGAVYG